MNFLGGFSRPHEQQEMLRDFELMEINNKTIHEEGNWRRAVYDFDELLIHMSLHEIPRLDGWTDGDRMAGCITWLKLGLQRLHAIT